MMITQNDHNGLSTHRERNVFPNTHVDSCEKDQDDEDGNEDHLKGLERKSVNYP